MAYEEELSRAERNQIPIQYPKAQSGSPGLPFVKSSAGRPYNNVKASGKRGTSSWNYNVAKLSKDNSQKRFLKFIFESIEKVKIISFEQKPRTQAE